jgi:DJ-1/PfpI family
VGPVKADRFVKSSQGLKVKVDMDFEDAHEELEGADVLVVAGGSTGPVVEANAEPIPLVKAWAELQQKDPSKERTLFSVCTGSLFLAKAGLLQGLAATTHPDYYTKFEIMCQEASQSDSGVGTDVQEVRYVVNNARFELGENILDNPFVYSKKQDMPRRKSIARKGSDSFKAARRRESIIKRANMPLGGLRVVTSGGVTAGMDAALYLVAALVSIESAEEVARVMQYVWQKGLCVDAIDV